MLLPALAGVANEQHQQQIAALQQQVMALQAQVAGLVQNAESTPAQPAAAPAAAALFEFNGPTRCSKSCAP